MRGASILVGLLCLLAATQVSADAVEDVAATLDAFHGAAADSNFDDYVSHMSDDIVFLGTDGSERWQGPAFRDFAQPYFARGQGWTYLPGERHISTSDVFGSRC